MDPERWRHVEDLFHRALEHPESARARFLDEQSGADVELREEVARWLAADAGAPAHLASAVGGAVRSLHDSASIDSAEQALDATPYAAPERIGPYRVTGEIGHGGMGAVYLAERADDQFRQQVAIKLVRHTIDSPVTRARFLQERQMLAQLNHPGIARLLDGGATEAGQPYFAMEYVPGRPLLDFCAVRAFRTRDRLQLFRHVCAAVQYAHQNLVVHRDIKPANILVTDDGQPKLLDFGIAKLIEEQEQGAAPRTVMLMLTPDYASPEQVRGDPVTTGADIYSLGCVLYELLSGKRPHVFASRTPTELQRVICDVEPVPPSRFAPLDEDLDNIVLKALRKDPALRYATAEQLAGDVQNYLEGRPVSARPPTLVYRTRKFVRRNRGAVAAVAVAMIAILIGTGAALWQARQASIQRDMAERRAREGRRLANTVLFSVEEKIRNLAGTTDARRLIMESGIAYLDDLAKDASGDSSLRVELARAYERIGEVQGTGPANLGQSEAARTSFQRAIGLLEPVDDSIEVRKLLASLYLNHFSALLREGAAAQARESLQKSLDLAGSLFAANPGDADVYRILASGYSNRATAEIRNGNIKAAVAATEQALTLTRDWAAKHPDATTEMALAAASERYAVALGMAGDLKMARTIWQELILLRERLTTSDATLSNRITLARTYNMIGDALGSPFEPNSGEIDEAMQYYKKSLAIRETLNAEDPANLSAAIDIAYTLLNIAALERESAPEHAVRTMQRAVDIAVRTLKALPTNANARRSAALMNMMYASALTRARRYGEALALYPAIFDVLESIRKQEPGRATVVQELMNAYGERGDLLMAMGSRGDALNDYMRAHALGNPLRQSGNLRVDLMLAATYERLEKYFRSTGDPATACDWARRDALLWEEWAASAPSAFSARGMERARAALASCTH
jgi:eukaryotic-like serine/threonine-protein kinase